MQGKSKYGTSLVNGLGMRWTVGIFMYYVAMGSAVRVLRVHATIDTFHLYQLVLLRHSLMMSAYFLIFDPLHLQKSAEIDPLMLQNMDLPSYNYCKRHMCMPSCVTIISNYADHRKVRVFSIPCELVHCVETRKSLQSGCCGVRHRTPRGSGRGRIRTIRILCTPSSRRGTAEPAEEGVWLTNI